MADLQDIFANPMWMHVLMNGAATLLLAAALAAVWFCRPSDHTRDESKIGQFAPDGDRHFGT